MSMFNRNSIQGDLFNSASNSAKSEHPEGTYNGTISKVVANKTAAGHRVINITITTAAGIVSTGLNMDHPSCTGITDKNIAQILDSYKNPPSELDTIEDIMTAIRGLPVVVHVKHKGVNDRGYRQYGVYFNRLDDAMKVEFSGGAPKARVEF